MPMWYWEPDPEHRLGASRKIRYSDSVDTIYGVTTEEMNFSLAEYCERFVHIEDRARALETYTQFAADRINSYQIDYRVVRSDGQVKHIRSQGEKQRDRAGNVVGAFGSITDIEDLLQYQVALHRMEGQLQQAHGLAKLGYWYWTPNPNNTSEGSYFFSSELSAIFEAEANPGAYQGTEFVNRFVTPEDRAMVSRTLQDYEAEVIDSYRMEYRAITTSGKEKFIRSIGERLRDPSGSPVCGYGIAQDITEPHARELALSEATERAEIASRAKDRFLANMSHELRTPLNAIIGFSDVLARDLFSQNRDRYREYATNILDSAQFLLQIINDILDMSRIEAGKIALHESVCDLGQLASSCARLIEPKAQETGIDLHLNVAPDYLVHADERALKQIVMNLLANAVKFTPKGGTIDICFVDQDDHFGISVKDTGIGIDSSGLDQIFKPFEQIDGSIARKYGGTGLGLAISDGLAKMHGGRIQITSEIGKGTEAAILLPNARRVAAEMRVKFRSGV